MQLPEAYYKELLSGFIQGNITTEQVTELYAFIEREPEIYERLMHEPDIIEVGEEQARRSTKEMLPDADSRIRAYLQTYMDGTIQDEPAVFRSGQVKSLFRESWKLWTAAAVLLGIVITVAVIFDRHYSSGIVASRSINDDINAPSHSKAQVRLADGSTVSLDSLQKGLLAQQGNVKLIKLANGKIAYQATGNEAVGEVPYNTLFNPRGSRVIDVALSDGSHVWLNAGSAITYPVAFMGNERKVSITGEAYFEVANDESKPFYVVKRNLEVKVLGTHFNVNAYDDETDMKITLLEGAVKVSNSNTHASDTSFGGRHKASSDVTLRPGQQAVVTSNTTGASASADLQFTVLNSIDLSAVIAWKNGLFNFNKVPLQELMRQLARWYDVEVEYQGAIAPKKFGGEIQRDLNLSEVLEGLKDIGVHFKIEGKKLIVMP